MITSIGSSNETLTQILEKLNSIDTDGSKGISKKELNSLEQETEFSKQLMECFDALDTDKDGNVTSKEVFEQKELLGNLGVPAGLEIEDISNSSKSSGFEDSIKKIFDKIDTQDIKDKLTDYLKTLYNQYKDNPMNALKDAASLLS